MTCWYYSIPRTGFGKAEIGRLLRKGEDLFVALRWWKKASRSTLSFQLELLLLGARLARLVRICVRLLPLLLTLFAKLLLAIDDQRKGE
jgi:hypothetical protein